QGDAFHRHRHRHGGTVSSLRQQASHPSSILAQQAREGGDEEEGARTGLLRRRRSPPQPPATQGDNNSTSKDKKGEIARAIRDGLSSLSSPRTRLSLSCWTSHPIRRSRRGSGTAGGEHGTPADVKVTATRPPSRKVIAAGARSLIERNDFYCQECNTHK
ncbi:uncharacterized protein LOC123441615, partial [Hordeum vulgare subsp. vulgare]|uniref:uncharacterized protein LOC123441615 n=1 Tax=Hordeum vulgare subsp. vulgare TaxID=112509 RepID=UPI001D1A50E2